MSKKNFEIRKMVESDKKSVVDMMRKFYSSPALITKGSEKIFLNNVESCLKNSPYIDGFVFSAENKIVGYGIVAKSFSTEFGGECVWIEDIYLEENFRGQGIGSSFINFVKENYPQKILRIEAEHENLKAVQTYKNFGFKELPYLEMVFVKEDI